MIAVTIRALGRSERAWITHWDTLGCTERITTVRVLSGYLRLWPQSSFSDP